MTNMKIPSPHHEEGVAILFAMILVGFLLSIVLTLGAIFLPKIRAAADTKSSAAALYAADSVVEWCIYIKNKAPEEIPELVMDNGATISPTKPNICLLTPLQASGTYHGVQRSFQASF